MLPMNVKGKFIMKPSAYNTGATLNALCLGTSAAKQLGLSLEHQAMITLPSAAALTVTCLEGSLWITRNNQPEDIILGTGESLAVAKGGQTIVYALKPSRFSMATTQATAASSAAPQRRARFNWTPQLGFAGIAEWS